MTFRLLPPAEWPRLITEGVEPFASVGILPDPEHGLIVVAEVDGRIMGVSSLLEAVHNHWWIRPDARRSPTMVTGLWETTYQTLVERNCPMIHTTVDERQVEVQAMVERMGYMPAPGQLYLLPIEDCVLNERKG